MVSASGAFLALACIFNYLWSKFMHLRVQSVPLAQIGVVGQWLVGWSVAPSRKLSTSHKLCSNKALLPRCFAVTTQLFVFEKYLIRSQVLGRWVEPPRHFVVQRVSMAGCLKPSEAEKNWLHGESGASPGEFLPHGQTGPCGVKTLGLKDGHQHRIGDVWMLPVTKSEKIAKRRLMRF